MKHFTVPIGLFLLLLAVYVWTMAPGNFWIDSAAFAACNAILGLPHPPGFPVYTVVGRVFDTLIPASSAMAGNMYSAVAAAASGTVLYLIFNLVMVSVIGDNRIRRMAAATGTLFACFALPVWQSAVRSEVYALQLLLSLLVVFCFLTLTQEGNLRRRVRYGLAAVFVQGLAFANHPLLALITVPLILALPFFLPADVIRRNIGRYAVAAVMLFGLAFSFYVYLPVRANQDPAINSGQPKTLTAAARTITRTGENYLPTATATKEVDYIKRIEKLGLFLFDQTGGIVLLGLGIGLFVGIRRRAASILALTALIPVGLGITVWAADFTPVNFDIVAYCGLPLILLIIPAFVGLAFAADRFKGRTPFNWVIPVVFALMGFFQLSGNMYAADLSATDAPDRLALSILDLAPKNSLVIVNEDNVLLPLWYHCHAAGQRPDIALVSSGGLYRPSYRDELRRMYPELKYPAEFDEYKIADLAGAIRKFCRMNRTERPIQVQYGVPGIDAGQLIPDGFLFRYVEADGPDYYPGGVPTPGLLDSLKGDASDLLTRDFIARTAFNYGVYFDQVGNNRAAFGFFQYAIETDEDNPEYLLRLGVAFLKAGKQAEAVMLLEQAVKTGDGCPEAETLLSRINEKKYGGL